LQGQHTINSPACGQLARALQASAERPAGVLGQGQAWVVAEMLVQDIGISVTFDY